MEIALSVGVNLSDHHASLGIEDDTVVKFAIRPMVFISSQDDDVILIDLAEYWLRPNRELGVNQLPCLCSQPEHLYRSQVGDKV